MTRRSKLALLVAILATAALSIATDRAEEYTLERCAERVRDHPDDYRSYRCYWKLSRRGHQDDALRALEALLAIDPGNPHVLYYLGHIERERHGERVMELYRGAAMGFADRGVPDREVMAWLALYDRLRRGHDMSETEAALERAASVAETAGDPYLTARVLVWKANFLSEHRSDYGAALRYLRDAERLAFPDGPSGLKSELLREQAVVYSKLRRYPEALECYRRRAQLPGLGPFLKAHSQTMITMYSAKIELPTGQMSHEEYVRRLEEAVDGCVEAGVRFYETTPG